ncbi:hypothetical protein [Thiorhodococcus minor]|uniref:hypothetical protein n=1 Tax=Thiorhodococcus minor TaxID=57489 RepID=UPI001ADA3545|nr:hypothetical protein [Thiorhodococcus minor]
MSTRIIVVTKTPSDEALRRPRAKSGAGVGKPAAFIPREGLRGWLGGPVAAERQDRLFDDRALGIALERLARHGMA